MADAGPQEAPKKPSRAPRDEVPGRPSTFRTHRRSPPAPLLQMSGVRIVGDREVFSTDLGATIRPQPGDCKVVQIASTEAVAETSSRQVRPLWICGQPRSTDCGHRSPPQGAIKVVHRRPTGSAALPTASPHPCPLFGNETPRLTASSERRHTDEVGWPVGNVGKAGDGAGEKSPRAVHRMCRTFGRPQKHRVVHRLRPQARWTKKRV